MPSKMLTMGVSPTTFVLERVNAKIVVDAITVDNTLGAQDAILTVQDSFTPSASAGVLLPVPVVVNRLGINEAMGGCDIWPPVGIPTKDLEIIGNLLITIATPDGGCRVTVAYHDE